MKRSTAIRHLIEMAEVASERLRLRDTSIGWPLEEMWVTGELLGPGDDLEAGSVVLVLDVPADELPWLAVHPTGEWVGEQLRLGKRPCCGPTGRSDGPFGTTSSAGWPASGQPALASTSR